MADQIDDSADATVQGVSETGGALLAPGISVGRYTVLELLGQGGMGSVYKAYDPELDRSIALKVLSPKSSGSESTLQARGRLMREAKALAQLSHPNVVAVHDVGRFEGSIYIAMELVEGETGRDWLQLGNPSQSEILEVFRQAGEGLLAAHLAGLVHRDFKPSNVIIGEDGRVRVADFGLVRSLNSHSESENVPIANVESREIHQKTGNCLSNGLTQAGTCLGTPAYMSPEQILGRSCDARTDQYSFCVSLYEVLYGEKPFQGRTFDELKENVLAGRRNEPEEPTQVPEWINDILQKGLSRDPEDRYPSMRELLEALAADPEEAARRAREARRRSFQYVGLGAALASGLVLLGLYLARGKELCRGGESLLSPVWNEAAKGKIRAQFVATGRPYAEDTYRRVEGHLDQWSREWLAMHQEACEATRVRGEQSEPMLDLRMECLRRELANLKNLVAIFGARSDAAVLDKAVEASLDLGELKLCADRNALQADYPPPKTAETKAKVAHLRERLTEVEVLRKTGKLLEGLELARKIEGEARAVDYPPVRAEALYWLGFLLNETGDSKKAEATLFDAARAAGDSRDVTLAAKAMDALVMGLGYYQDRHAEGLMLGRSAEVMLLAAGADKKLQSELFNSIGTVLWRKAEPAQALLYFRKALALLETAEGHEQIEVARCMINIGLVSWGQGEYGVALSYYQRSLEILENTLGPEHTYVSVALNNLGGVSAMKGAYDEAIAYFQRALAITEKSLGPDHPHVARLLNNLGDVVLKKGQNQKALSFFEKSLAIWEKASGPLHPDLANPLSGIAIGLIKLKKYREAMELLERVLNICHKTKCQSEPYGSSLFGLARALAASGGDRARAIELAKEAQLLFGETPQRFKSELEEIDAWLTGQGAK